MWSSIHVHSIRELKSIKTSHLPLVVFVHFRTDCDQFRWLLDEKEHKGRRYGPFTQIYSHFWVHFQFKKYGRWRLFLRGRTKARWDSTHFGVLRFFARQMCIFWTRFSAKIAFLPISETLQRKVSLLGHCTPLWTERLTAFWSTLKETLRICKRFDWSTYTFPKINLILCTQSGHD
jgi:hypothetical protein